MLLGDDVELLRPIVHTLMSAGYLPSAKHPFQLLRTLDVRDFVSGGYQKMIFNVDLMHPSEGAGNPDMFADIMELNVYENYDPKKVSVKSIIFPSSNIVFDEHLWSYYSLDAVRPDGSETVVKVPLLTEAGCILSKCESVTKKKRERDAFDIYYILTSTRGYEVASELKALAGKFSQVAKQLDVLKDYLETQSSRFCGAVTRYVPPALGLPEEPSATVNSLLFS